MGEFGRHAHPVVRPGFKPGGERQPFPGRFDSCYLPPSPRHKSMSAKGLFDEAGYRAMIDTTTQLNLPGMELSDLMRSKCCVAVGRQPKSRRQPVLSYKRCRSEGTGMAACMTYHRALA